MDSLPESEKQVESVPVSESNVNVDIAKTEESNNDLDDDCNDIQENLDSTQVLIISLKLYSHWLDFICILNTFNFIHSSNVFIKLIF